MLLRPSKGQAITFASSPGAGHDPAHLQKVHELQYLQRVDKSPEWKATASLDNSARLI